MIAAYLPNSDQLLGWVGVMTAAGLFWLAGGAAAGRGRLPAADLAVGWTMVAVLFLLGGVATGLSFTALTFFILALMPIALWLRLRRGDLLPSSDGLRIIVLMAPLFAVAMAMQPSQWDEFSQWLPNARYIVEFDALPRTGRPPSDSVFPAYPYTLPLIAYFASRFSGVFADFAPALFNLLLLASMAALLLHLFRRAAGLDGQAGWRGAALALLAATALSPTFVPKLVLTAYADVATAAALAFAGLLCWALVEALADRRPVRGLAVQACFALVLLVLLKQVNLILFALLILAVILLILRRSGLPKLRALALTAAVAAPALLLYLLWRAYVGHHLAGGEMMVQAAAHWRLEELPHILGRMGHVATQKGGYFLLSLALTAGGIAALIRPDTPVRRLCLLYATVFLGYNAFLAVAYATVFTEYEGRNVASYWRYNTHLGLFALLSAAFALGRLWPRLAARPAWRRIGAGAGFLALILAVAAPPALASRLRFDRHPVKSYVRDVARDLRPLLPQGATLIVFDPRGNGFYPIFLDYLLGQGRDVDGAVTAVTPQDVESLRKVLAKPAAADHVWVHTSVPAVAEALGMPLENRASHLLARDGSGWRLVRSWPFPGYDDPVAIPD